VTLWLNVPRAVRKLLLKNLGRWLVGLTRQEREWNLQSACASAVAKPSEQHLASRKSDLLESQNELSIFFGFVGQFCSSVWLSYCSVFSAVLVGAFDAGYTIYLSEVAVFAFRASAKESMSHFHNRFQIISPGAVSI
jgi:hypothetical protein